MVQNASLPCSIAKKILAVMADIGELKKDKKNDFHNYQYASDELIVGSIRAALIKHSLAILPSQKSCTEIVTKTLKGEDMIITKLEMEFELIDADSGETKTKTFFGYGSDKGDKGVYKASTGCEKYFLMKTFLIATPDDPEFDRTQREARSAFSGRTTAPAPKPAAPPPAAPAPVAPPAPTPAKKEKTPQTIVNGLIDDIKKVTPKSGDPFYRVTDAEGASYATWSETLAKTAKSFMEQKAHVAFAVRFEERGPVLDGIRPI